MRIIIGTRTYRVVKGHQVQVARWNQWMQRNDWEDVKTEATRRKVLALLDPSH